MSQVLQGVLSCCCGSAATLVLAGLLTSATSANAQFYYGGPPPGNRWIYGSRPGGNDYVPGEVIYGEPERTRWHNRGGDALKTKAQADLKKAVPPPAVKGPLLIAVSIADQRLTVYDDGVPIAHTRCRPAPQRIRRRPACSTSSEGALPSLQSLQQCADAVHAADHLVGRCAACWPIAWLSASHGCIRLPYRPIRDPPVSHHQKYGRRKMISHEELTPTEIAHARLFVPRRNRRRVAGGRGFAPAKTEVPQLQLVAEARRRRPAGKTRFLWQLTRRRKGPWPPPLRTPLWEQRPKPLQPWPGQMPRLQNVAATPSNFEAQKTNRSLKPSSPKPRRPCPS